MRMKMVDCDGVKIRTIYEGDPKNYPVLLIHGFGACAEHWIKNIDALSDQFYVIAPDLACHGFSDHVSYEGKPPYPMTVKYLLKLADKSGLKNFCPVGSSYGALIAALLYFERPQQVNKLVINGSGSCFNTEEELAAGLKGAYNNAMTAMRDPTYASCLKRLQNTTYDGGCVPGDLVISQLLSYTNPKMIESYEAAMKGMMDIPASRPYRILERLDQLKVDTLVCWGREDPRGVYASAVKAVAKMPKARLETFEKCGHLPFLEYPERWNGVLRTFLADQAAKTRSAAE